MVKGLYTAYTGLINEQNRMDVVSNNLANATTTGFKKEGTTSQAFDEVLAYKIKDTSELGNMTKKLGSVSLGVKIGENYTDFSQGSLKTTNNALDLSLSSDGFFAVEVTNKAGDTSTMYTRDGAFLLNKDGNLVTKDGGYVLDKSGNRIQLNPLKEVSITEEGGIYQEEKLVATIQVAAFEDNNYLEKYGENYYKTVDGATLTESNAQVLSGYLETSNVQVVNEMVDLIAISRAYETSQKVVQAYDDSLDITVNQLGRI
ncbi:MAG: flagellar basal-body rod protein FlgF [Lachnospiraceae bacterium]